MTRYSSDSHDRGYPAWQALQAEGKYVEVYLDGDRQDRVYTVDDEAGIVVRPALDAQGHLQAHPDSEHILTESVSGSVELRVKDIPLASYR